MRFGAACALVLGLWLIGASCAYADELVIDLRPAAPLAARHDDGRDPTLPALPAPSYRSVGPRNIDRIQLAPWPPVQGQTLIVTLWAREAMTYSLSFAGRPYPIHGGNRSAWSLAPVPPLQKVGYTPLIVAAGAQTLTVNVPVRAGVFETINIPASASEPILSNATRVNTELQRVTEVFARVTEGGWNPRSTFEPPLHGTLRHTSAFGSRRTYGNNPALSAHAGEDYGAVAGTPVYAPAGGAVALAEPLFVRGNAVILDHGNGVLTGYWHLSELAVKAGERVTPGQLIGKVGSTGLSTGAHLHWELRVAGLAVDPLQWVED